MKPLPFMTPAGYCPACVEPIRIGQRVMKTAAGEVHRKCVAVTVQAFEREARDVHAEPSP